ncbi:hypothetical protein XA68_12736 [Ophiocordyceps unilateralis]|uniref:Uncharacterized protein n=1 Tax=Ophiocordyceps unilateralis TaxID=268505 RepID=A0A2A9PCC2_OPHUN|nr:hypothetical protein XA68_12736 [Ophiocordyceps unilateralis]
MLSRSLLRREKQLLLLKTSETALTESPSSSLTVYPEQNGEDICQGNPLSRPKSQCSGFGEDSSPRH